MKYPITAEQAAVIEEILTDAIKNALFEAMKSDFPPGHYADDVCWSLCQPVWKHTDECNVSKGGTTRHECDCGAYEAAMSL